MEASTTVTSDWLRRDEVTDLTPPDAFPRKRHLLGFEIGDFPIPEDTSYGETWWVEPVCDVIMPKPV